MKRRVDAFRLKGDLERRVVTVWRKTLTEKTIVVYLYWVRRFQIHCRQSGLDEIQQLTLAGALAFAQAYYGLRRGSRVRKVTREGARSALNAWAHALRTIGVDVLDWHEPPRDEVLPRVLHEFRTYRLEQSGVAKSTVQFDVKIAAAFRDQLRSQGRKLHRIRVKDIDEFVAERAKRVRPKALGSTCTCLRSFLRFLHATGRLRRDLAVWVDRPKPQRLDRPPRAIPLRMIKRLLQVAKKRGRTKLRDYALLLVMTTYGMGGAEVRSIRLEDVDWAGNTIKVRRPKTGVVILLPLLPAVAAALAQYLRMERARSSKAREIFVTGQMPHRSITTAAINSIVRKNAAAAGISAPMLGANIFRHSHACHQIETGANVKVVGDILGHRSPMSTSAYVRVAINTLRKVALEVPAG